MKKKKKNISASSLLVCVIDLLRICIFLGNFQETDLAHYPLYKSPTQFLGHFTRPSPEIPPPPPHFLLYFLTPKYPISNKSMSPFKPPKVFLCFLLQYSLKVCVLHPPPPFPDYCLGMINYGYYKCNYLLWLVPCDNCCMKCVGCCNFVLNFMNRVDFVPNVYGFPPYAEFRGEI